MTVIDQVLLPSLLFDGVDPTTLTPPASGKRRLAVNESFVLGLVDDVGAFAPVSASGIALTDLTDVVAPTPSEQDVLVFNTGLGRWVNSPSPGGLVLVEQHTAANSAALVFTTAISSAYDEYLIELVNVLPVTDADYLRLRCSTNGGSTYDSGANYSWDHFGWRAGGTGVDGAASGKTSIVCNWSAGTGQSNTAAKGGVCGMLRLFNPLSTSMHKVFVGQAQSHSTATDTPIGAQVQGRYQSTSAVDALEFTFNGGNLNSGTIRIYGLAK